MTPQKKVPLVVLCGGLGTRIRSVIGDVPKILAPIRGSSFLEYQVSNWLGQGIEDIVLLLGYQSEKVILEIRKLEKKFNITLRYIIEETQLGTGGALLNFCANYSYPSFILVNGDTWLTDFFNGLSNCERTSIGLIESNESSRYGSVQIGPTGRVSRFLEKGKKSGGLINAGATFFMSDDLKQFGDQIESLEKQIYPALIKNDSLFFTKLSGEFIDIGIPIDYELFIKNYAVR
jgi:D-glycero-alpha-D-manno-heptose 1-phosphate guanylyltransferase